MFISSGNSVSNKKILYCQALVFLLGFMFAGKLIAVNITPNEENEINLGAIEYSQNITKSKYSFLNVGDTRLHVDRVKASCGCVVADYPEFVDPQQTVDFNFTFFSEGKIGKVSTYVAIYFREKSDPLKVIIKAYKENATVTEGIMFPDIYQHRLQLNINTPLGRPILLKIFGRDHPDSYMTMKNLKYNSTAMIVKPTDYSSANYRIKLDGKTWYYVEKQYVVEIYPNTLGIGVFKEDITINNIPFLIDENRKAAHKNLSLNIDLYGRVLGNFYSVPSSLNFLIDRKSNKSYSKEIKLFNKNTVEYRYEYDKTKFQVYKQGEVLKLNIKDEALKQLISSNASKVEEKIRFHYKDQNNESNVYDLQVNLMIY